MVDSLAHDVPMQRLEPEFGTPGRQRFNDTGHVVADEHKASDFGVSFHGAPQSILGILNSPQELVTHRELAQGQSKTIIKHTGAKVEFLTWSRCLVRTMQHASDTEAMSCVCMASGYDYH